MIIWNRLRRVAAIGMAVLAGCATTAATAPKPAKPAMWRVADHDTSIYLFGTVHLLPAGYQWRTQRFNEVAGRADRLIVETIIDEKNPQAFLADLARMSVSPGLPPIVERVPADKRDALRAVIAKSGVPEAALNNMETWAAAFVLLQVQFQNLGLSGGSGVETSLKSGFVSAGKPVEQLETNAEQLGLFDTLPEKAQREFLISAIDDPAKVREQFDGMLQAWVSGDVAAIGRTFNSEMKDSPELRAALIDRRNAKWSQRLEQRMAQPGTSLVAVGAGHLAGKGSVIDMLKKRGLRVERVQ